MTNIAAVARRELGAYFNSPIAYIVATLYLVLSGALYFPELFLGGQADLRGFFGLAPILFSILVPVLTMRLVAEEKSQGTLELLLTMPVTDWEVVLGKYFAAVGLIAIVILLTVPFALSVGSLGPLDKGATFAGYFGMLLMGATFAAIGLMCSAFSKHQIVAFIIAFSIGFPLVIIASMIQVMPHWLAPIVSAISMQTHFTNVARGVIDTRDLLYYLSMIGGSLVIAQASLESRRWR